MRERQAVKGRDTSSRDQKDALRQAQREAETAEQTVAKLERTILALTTTLADPELYTTTGGAASATRLGAELDQAKAALERAIESWTTATERAEALTSTSGAAGRSRG